ncbi:MAG: flagellar hook-associated protein FlgK [Thermodesulfobacteriota bacterium]|nr:flagellar hook-associated protein FlgK [Thermodesulfobacteriota bacterium]
MSVGVNLTLDIAKKAMTAQQTALMVTGHNIANVNTTGFSRQSAVLEAGNSLPSAFGPVGSGVEVNSIIGIYNKYLEEQIGNETEEYGKWEAMREALEQIEAVFNESSEYGLNSSMNEFWNSWQDVANNPSGQAERMTLVSVASTLATTLNDQYSNLEQIQMNLNDSIRGAVNEINNIVDQIAELNNKILSAEVGGLPANDYRDERTNLVKDLSEIIDINYFENPDGMLTVMIAEGKTVVEGTSSWHLEAEANINNNGLLDVKWDPSGGSALIDITSEISSGKLEGWLEMRDVTIEDYKSRLDSLASEIIEEVNRLHSDGAGINGYGTLTAANAVNNTSNPLDSVGLPFTPTNGSFEIYVWDSVNETETSVTITVDLSNPAYDGLDDIRDQINNAGINITASIDSNGFLTIASNDSSQYTFTFQNDDSDTLLALGLNTFFTGDDASTISVNSVVENDINKIAAATSSNSPGDNTNALAIADLQNALLLDSGTSTLDDYYNSLVSDVGVESQNASNMSSHQELILEQLENQRSSVSGVSLDEEMINLIKYQNAYTAATQLVSAIDEILRQVVEMV